MNRRSRAQRQIVSGVGVMLGLLMAAQAGRPVAADGGVNPGPESSRSKIASQAPASDPHGITRLDPIGAGTKNAAEPGRAARSESALPAIAGDSSGFMACGDSGNVNWTTTSTAWEVIRSCTATFPADGVVFINATAGLGLQDVAYEGRFGLSVDNRASALSATSRWVNIYPDAGDGTDKTVAASILLSVASGTHIFYFLGTRYSGSGTVVAYDPALSVAYFPAGSSQVMTCGVSSSMNFTTTSNAFVAVQSCALDLPSPGWVYLNATASAVLEDAPYEVQYHTAIDSNTAGTGWPDHWTNVYTDTGDGTDEALAASMLTQVGAGARTFYFGVSRYGGLGAIRLLNPSLSVLYFPENNVIARTCGKYLGAGDWQTTSSSYMTVLTCTLDLPASGFAIVDVNASAGLTYGSSAWEGAFRWGMDDPSGSSDTDRWTNVYTDTGDGTDRVVADSGLIAAPAGRHTFYFVAGRYSGSGNVELIRPSLTVLAPRGRQVQLPLLMR